MASKKAGGTAKNLTDSNPQYLGVKRYAGEKVGPGEIIVRQRGIKMLPGRNTKLGKDDTIFALAQGVVAFKLVRKQSFAGHTTRRSRVDVVEK